MIQKNIHIKILIHCQYVYGIGHLVRTLELAKGLSSRFRVYILNGGEAVPNFDIPLLVNCIQLPGIYKNETEDHLTPVDPSQSLAECFQMRQNIIITSIKEIEPDIVITEHFPFGLLFETEVIHLIHKAKSIKPKVKIVNSVRDIIESSKGGKKDNYVCSLINELYDLVLVHGDEKFVNLSHSFPLINKIQIPIVQTGYIVRTIPATHQNNSYPTILISVAGGRIGNELIEAVIDSHASIKAKKKHQLLLFSGAFQKDFKQQYDKVRLLESDDITIEKFDGDQYLNHLSKASLIICLGGYNSIIEALSIKKPLLVYSRDFAGGNKEQNLRIEIFEKSGHLEIILAEDLKAEKLSTLILNKLNNLEVPVLDLNVDGVQNSCTILSNLLNQ